MILHNNAAGLHNLLSHECVGFEALAVSTTSVGLASIPATAVFAVAMVEDQTLRYRADKTAPTATVGVRAKADVVLHIFGASLSAVRFIRQDGTDSALSVHYYR